jgi:hypothetical protein
VGDAAGAVRGLNLEPFFEPLQPVPEPLPAAQHDRHHDNVQVVDQAGGQELADGGRAAADADIPARGGLARLRKRLGGAGVEEVASQRPGPVPRPAASEDDPPAPKSSPAPGR